MSKPGYREFTLQLATARTNKKIHIEGDFIQVKSLDGDLQVRVEEMDNPSIDLSIFPTIKTKDDFHSLFFTNTAQSGKTATLVVGSRKTFEVESKPYLEALSRIKGNYDDDIASDTDYDFTVPSGKRWWIYGGWTERLGTTVFWIEIYDADGQELLHSPQSDYGSTELDWGVFQDKDQLLDNFQVPFPLGEGMYVRYHYSKNPYNSSVSLLVMEEDV